MQQLSLAAVLDGQTWSRTFMLAMRIELSARNTHTLHNSLECRRPRTYITLSTDEDWWLLTFFLPQHGVGTVEAVNDTHKVPAEHRRLLR